MLGNMGLPWVSWKSDVPGHDMKRDANDRWGERGAWIGTQLGCTGWLAVAASLSAGEGSMAALVVFVLFAGANAAGLLLWLVTALDRPTQRNQLSYS